jgi:formylmethanofuran dehydrogenase subunit E
MKSTRRNFGAIAAMASAAALPVLAHDDEQEPPISRTAMVNGMALPFAVAGYLMGDHALNTLDLTRCHGDLDVTHFCPASSDLAVVIDGLQASTGASLGKRNLRHTESKDVYSLVRNRRTGKQVKLQLTDEFIRKHAKLSAQDAYAAGLKVAAAKDAEVFRVL